MRKIIIIVVIAMSAVLFAAMKGTLPFLKGEVSPARHVGVFYPMGGIPLRIIAYDTTRFKFSKDLDAVERRVEELENVFSSHRSASEIARINKEAHGAPFQMSDDMRRVLTSAREWRERTGGAFDVTVGSLVDLWSEASKKQTLPVKDEIENARKYSGIDKLYVIATPSLSRGKQSNGIATPAAHLWRARNDFSVQIDLGGIAKGDIVDQVASLLVARGVKRGVVDAGGDVLAFGDGTFRFGIQDPTAKAGEGLIGEIEVPAGAIVTSGDYERFAEIDGKKYSHIMDPRTGMPVDNGLTSVTVVGGRCIDADALATALMVLGRERAIELLRKNPEYKGILVEKNGDKYIVWVESGLISSTHFEGPWSDRIRTF